jgi:hypothetical protein
MQRSWKRLAVLHEIPLVRTATRSVAMPTLREFVKRDLESDVAHLAETTRSDRASYLSEKGPLVVHLGDARLDDIDAPALREWWAKVVDIPYKDASGRVRKRGTSTGRHYLNVLARWCGGDAYRAPLVLLAGEVPADLLARLGGEVAEVPTRVPTSETAEVADSPNPRPQREFLERETGFEPATLSLGI